MKAMVLGMLLLSLFMAVSEVKSERSPVRLCGREFVRAVVFTCGGSRWRRQLTHFPEGVSGASENEVQKPEFQSNEFTQPSSEAERDLWGKEQKSIQKRHDDVMRLIISCCAVGCSESTLSSLC